MDDLLKFLLSGNHLAAVGAALVLFVGMARTGLAKKWPWFGSTVGGYVLAWGTTSVLYVGTAFEQGTLPTLQLIEQALATGFAASGIFNHWQDIIGATKKIPPAVAKVGLVLLVGGCSLSAGCHSAPAPIQDVINCAEQDQGAINQLAAQCAADVPDWAKVEACAVAALPTVGYQVGSCVIADIVQQFLVKKGATIPVNETYAPNGMLEDFRSKYGHHAAIKVHGLNL